MAENRFAPDNQLIDVWYIRRGSTFRKHYTWKTGPKEGPHVPVDLTGWSIRGTIRDKTDQTIVLIDLTDNTKATLALGGVSGEIDIEINADTAVTLAAKKGVFDVELVNGSFVKNFVGGEVVFLGEHTRA